MQKQAVEKVKNQTYLSFFNRLFLIPKQVETYLRSELTEKNSEIREIKNGDTRQHNNFLANRLMGNIYIDYSNDVYFHIPINPQPRKYLHFHIYGQSYQVNSLHFCLTTAPMEFTAIAKEVKLMAQNKGIRIHQ